MIRWVSIGAARRIQEKMVTEFGGLGVGARDQGLLESALSRPKNLHAYADKSPDYGALAASYAYGIAKNHPFLDANKRTAFQVMELFLGLNGMRLCASDQSCVEMMCAMAASEIGYPDFEAWVKKNARLDAPLRRPALCP